MEENECERFIKWAHSNGWGAAHWGPSSLDGTMSLEDLYQKFKKTKEWTDAERRCVEFIEGREWNKKKKR
jgi:hypothetical protein